MKRLVCWFKGHDWTGPGEVSDLDYRCRRCGDWGVGTFNGVDRYGTPISTGRYHWTDPRCDMGRR